jgi:hypothetical protein
MSDNPISLEPIEAPQPGPRLYALSSLIDTATADAQARYDSQRNGTPLGALTPIPELTKALGGALSVGVHILHGSPGSGKTAFALQTASKCQCPALFVTCEMEPIELLRRIASRVTGTYLGRFKSGEMHPNMAREHFEAAARSAPMLAILDATTTALPPSLLLELAAAHKAKYPDNPHYLIALDSVHSWVSGFNAGTAEEYDALNIGLDAIRMTAQKLDAAALCIAERNRGTMRTGGQSASAGTRRFEYGAESVIELDRDLDNKADAHGNGDIKLKVSKNRHGETLSFDLKWHGACQEFKAA